MTARPPRACQLAEALECLDRSADDVARRKGEFLSLAAHSLSQPVQTLELAYFAMQRNQWADADLAELATDSLSRLRTLLGQLLEISRVESGSIQLDEQLFSIPELCADLERRLGPRARDKGLEFRCSACSCLIETDPALLGGVLSHLLSNAIDFTNTGEISLECTRTAEGGVEIAVRDSGIGIEQQHLQDIFRDFYRSEAACQIAPKGCGLGLGLVRRWSNLLGIPVTVRSQVSRGSTFAVQIPAEKVRAFPAPETIACR